MKYKTDSEWASCRRSVWRYCLFDILIFDCKAQNYALIVNSVSSLQEKPQPSTTTFVLNQLNQLPSLGTIVVTKPSTGTASRQTITVTKVVHTSSTAQRSSSSSPTVCTVQPNNEQIRLKDLLRTSSLKTSSLGELMKLKPPHDIAQPVATATATGTSECWTSSDQNVFFFACKGLSMQLSALWHFADLMLSASFQVLSPAVKTRKQNELKLPFGGVKAV